MIIQQGMQIFTYYQSATLCELRNGIKCGKMWYADFFCKICTVCFDHIFANITDIASSQHSIVTSSSSSLLMTTHRQSRWRPHKMSTHGSTVLTVSLVTLMSLEVDVSSVRWRLLHRTVRTLHSAQGNVIPYTIQHPFDNLKFTNAIIHKPLMLSIKCTLSIRVGELFLLQSNQTTEWWYRTDVLLLKCGGVVNVW